MEKEYCIKKGQKAMCIKTVAMKGSNQIAFIEDKTYESTEDGFLIDEVGHLHMVEGVWFDEHFTITN